eukprot:365858-Chlamydomonas_euryale.AAC.5
MQPPFRAEARPKLCVKECTVQMFGRPEEACEAQYADIPNGCCMGLFFPMADIQSRLHSAAVAGLQPGTCMRCSGTRGRIRDVLDAPHPILLAHQVITDFCPHSCILALGSARDIAAAHGA